MNVRIDISKRLQEQFAHYFQLKEVDGVFRLDPAVGLGEGMKYLALPGQMEFYHFQQTRFRVPIDMKSVNPIDSSWHLIHINLSKTKQQKYVDGRAIDFQKHLPIGILLYGPGLEIETRIPPDVDSELASIRFHRTFLDLYFDDWEETFDVSKNLVYEDLDYRLEGTLGQALESMHDKLLCHSRVLEFMSQLFEKLKPHGRQDNHGKLRSREIDGLFRAATYLRNPLSTNVPALDELAAVANMGATKFKSSFKQLFGSAPLQYRNRIRMEYAREEILARRKAPTELSYLLGYSHPSNFTAAYKKHFGELPSATQ